jgi:hypothetical protein
MKKLWLIPLGLALLALIAAPMAIRWLTYHQGGRQARTIPRPDLSGVEAAAPARTTYVDDAKPAPAGTILVDDLHDNQFGTADLALLRERLSARGQTLEMADSADNLPEQLRYAKALVVISPHDDWAPAEIERVRELVGHGGRLLLVADATHYNEITDDWGYLIGLDHDAPHLNSLAVQFGISFQPDYLYNMVDNENNYRNVRLSDMADDPLTEGVAQLVFFGTRSLTSTGIPLVSAGADTVSNADDRVVKPVTVALGADGPVLALGDASFLTEPYNGIADNDRFASNIADWLSAAERHYAMEDLPYFFGEKVDLVYASDPLLDSDLLPGGGDLQALLGKAGKSLSIEAEENRAHDTILLGLYTEAGEAEPYLEKMGVALMLPPKEPAVDPMSDYYTATLTATEELTSRVEIESLGSMVIDGTALILLRSQGERRVLVVLSDTVSGLEAAIGLLVSRDLKDCVLHEDAAGAPSGLALCPTGELEEGEGTGGWPKPKEPEEEEGEEPWG